MLRFIQSLVVLTVVSFVWGCVPAPVKVPVEVEKKPSIEASKKKSPRKVIKKKKQKRRVPEKVQQPAVAVGPDGRATSEIETPRDIAPVDADPVIGRMMFHYNYYPGPQVYFDTIRHLYFYKEGSRWIMSVALPTSFQESLGESVRLKLLTDQPYTLHKEHQLKHPAVDRRRLFD